MLVYDRENLADFYTTLFDDLSRFGDDITPRGLPCIEIRPVVFYTTPMRPCLVRGGFAYRFAMAELMALVCGWNDVGWLARFNPSIARFSDNRRTFYGAYGYRLRYRHCDQLQAAISKLQADPDTRQVVLNIWDADDCMATSKDLPCNTQLLLKIRGDELHLTVIRRSADVVWGVPYDHFQFAGLLHVLAPLVDCAPGTLTEVIDSLHIYHPDAGFYDVARIEHAKKASEKGRAGPLKYLPLIDSLVDLTEYFTDVRSCVEADKPGDSLTSYLRGKPCVA